MDNNSQAASQGGADSFEDKIVLYCSYFTYA